MAELPGGEAAAAVRSVFETLRELIKDAEAQQRNRPAMGVRARGVGYCPPGLPRPLLQKVDFDLEPNTLGLIYGKSGSGKSTLLQILAGLTEVTGEGRQDARMRGRVAVVGVRCACARRPRRWVHRDRPAGRGGPGAHAPERAQCSCGSGLSVPGEALHRRLDPGRADADVAQDGGPVYASSPDAEAAAGEAEAVQGHVGRRRQRR